MLQGLLSTRKILKLSRGFLTVEGALDKIVDTCMRIKKY